MLGLRHDRRRLTARRRSRRRPDLRDRDQSRLVPGRHPQHEVAQRQVVRRQARSGAAAARLLIKHEFLRLEACGFGQSFAEGIESKQLRLHLPQFGGHGIEVFTQVVLHFFVLLVLNAENQRIEQGTIQAGRISQHHPLDAERQYQHRKCRRDRARNQMRQGQRNGPRPGQFSGD